MTHLNDDSLVLLHYGEDAGLEAQAHLEACPQCAGRLRELGEILSLAVAPQSPEPDEGYEARVWARVQPQLAAREPRVRLFWARRWPRVAGFAALAASLLLAFLLGRQSAPRPQPLPPEVRERVLLVAVTDHLERSQMVLVELVNARAGEPMGLGAQREFADELVSANRLYRQAAARSGEPALAAVLEELERVLVELAAGPDALAPADLAGLQRRIDSQGLLFKVRVIQSQVRERERRLLPRTTDSS